MQLLNRINLIGLYSFDYWMHLHLHFCCDLNFYYMIEFGDCRLYHADSMNKLKEYNWELVVKNEN